MSIQLASTFNIVTIRGLIGARDLAAMFADLYADEDVREALQRAADASADLGADEGRSANQDAQARLDGALDTIAAEIKSTAVALEPDEARRLRELLIGARLGQDRANTWQSYRRAS